jgi:hypothetical protein
MKRTRSDSNTAAVQAARAVAEGPLKPPAHVKLRPGDEPFWNAVVCARARDTWNDVDLSKAANLARCQADIERITIELISEDDVVLNSKGTLVVNAKHTLLETLTRREIALSRAIHVHAEATVGKSEDASKRLDAEKKAQEAASKANKGGEGLIPGLRAVK